MRITRLFSEFFESEKAAGAILIVCTVLSIWLSNSSLSDNYLHFWHSPLWGHDVAHWVNDGLMAIFFLLVGLELEREVYAGELSIWRNAVLPVLAALGGMLVPALFYFFFNAGTDTVSGAGIPMATDIAFALGVLSLLGKRVPVGLKVFLTALAVIDDLGAILCIAIFYTQQLDFAALGLSLGIFVVLLVLNRLKVRNLIPYLIGGIGMWYFMLHSGVHATISGVLLAFAIPFGDGKEKSTSYLLQHYLHWPVAFVILPLFALANTAIVFPQGWYSGLGSSSSLGILVGLVLGKPLGILLLCWLAIKMGWGSLPQGVRWPHLLGAGLLAGIGFTMSIFITLLAFEQEQHILNAKIAILFSSLLAALLGLLYLSRTASNKDAAGEEELVGEI